MKKLLYFSVLAAITFLCSCQKQQTEAERNAEVERKVQERLAAERQAQAQDKLSQGQVDLDQRVKDLEAAKANAAAGSAQQTTELDQDDRSDSVDSPDDSGETPTGNYSTFYTRLSQKANGARHPLTDMSGNRASRGSRVTGGLTPTAGGFTRMRDGPGFPKNLSVGLPITTGAGRVCGISGGFGSLETNGRLPGFRGARVMTT